jgi:WD40 repeat protein
VTACAVGPDGARIVSASGDRTLKVWDALTGEVRRTLQGHTGVVLGCAISPDGAWIASASRDHTLRVWDIHTGMCASTLHVDAPLASCAWSPRADRIVAGGQAGLYLLRFVH